MNWRSRIWLLDGMVPLCFGSALCLLVPLRTTLEFGMDEGFELMKAWLVSLGHPLYRGFWNDQPPLHTELLALLFRIFGPSAFVGRLLSVVFAMALVGALYQVVRQRSGRAAGLLAVGMLLASRLFIELSVSVMLELPAMAMALASVWAWFRYLQCKQSKWLIISGMLFGFALQVKFTAVLLLPALLMDYLVNRQRMRQDIIVAGRRQWWRSHREGLLWCCGALMAFGAILLIFYRIETMRVFFGSHFSPGTKEVVASEGYRFRLESLFVDWAISVPTTVGIVMIFFRRRWNLLLPVVLLASALAVHSLHRPFWYYYHLHFSIPMAWLGAVGIVELFQLVWKQAFGASLWGKLRFGMGFLTWSAVASLVLTSLPENLAHELAKVRTTHSATEDWTVAAFKSHAAKTRWVFTNNRIAAFWAGLPLPPELAVIPAKRVWSGQIGGAEVLSALKRYQPEQILVPSDWETQFGLSDYLREHYRPDPSDEGGNLYLRN